MFDEEHLQMRNTESKGVFTFNMFINRDVRENFPYWKPRLGEQKIVTAQNSSLKRGNYVDARASIRNAKWPAVSPALLISDLSKVTS